MPDADAAGPSGQAPTSAAATASTSRQPPRRSNKANADQPTEACALEQEGPPGKAALGPAGNDEAEGGDTDARASGKSLEELAVRFSQATKELQVRVS